MSTPGFGKEFVLPFPDRRAVARIGLVRTDSTLVVSGAERTCRIRDISPIGIGLGSLDLPYPGQRVWVEMRGMARSAAVVVWRDPVRCGLRFEERQNMQPVTATLDDAAKKRPRAPRYSLGIRADLESSEGVSAFDVIDISMGGLKLGGASRLALGSRVTVKLDGLPDDLPGQIVWKRNDAAGCQFDRPVLGNDLFNFLCCRA